MITYNELDIELSDFIEKLITYNPTDLYITKRSFIFFKYGNLSVTQYKTSHEFNKFKEGRYEIDNFLYEIRYLLRNEKITKLKSK